MGSPILELQYISRFRVQDIIRSQNHSSKYEGPYYLRAKFFSSAESREASASRKPVQCLFPDVLARRQDQWFEACRVVVFVGTKSW